MKWVGLLAAFGTATYVAWWAEKRSRSRLQGLLPVLDDEAFTALSPADVEPDRWLAARRELAVLLRLDPERLSPEMALDALRDHFDFFIFPSIDLDGVYEIRLGHVEPGELEQMSTVGDLLAILVRHPEPSQ